MKTKSELALDIKSLTFAYQSSAVPVLSIDSLQIAQGEKVFLKGDSGSGKSTLLGLITGIHSASEGQIWVLGEAFHKISSARRDVVRGTRLGYIFQQFNLIPYLNVSDNILLPVKLQSGRISRFKERNPFVEMKRLAKDLSIVNLLGRPVSELSVGQQQRVAVARALISFPDFVLADEPTSALDYDQKTRFLELLLSECKRLNSSLLFVSHDPSLAKYFDRELEMKTLNRVGSPRPGDGLV